MRIEAITAHCFRNLAAVQLTVTAPIVVLKGQNGQGKTNLLEAMYLCATGRSFRQAPARDMLQHGQVAAHVTCDLQRQGVRHQVAVKVAAHGRTLRVDDRALRHQAMLLELVNMVAFFPDDLHIAKGGPEGRRRFLDRAVAGCRPDFVRATLDYHRALKARNALLRAPSAPDRGLLSVYDEQLVRFGDVMHQARGEVLHALQPVAQRHFATMMPEVGPLSVQLHAGVPAFDAAAIGRPTEPPMSHSAQEGHGAVRSGTSGGECGLGVAPSQAVSGSCGTAFGAAFATALRQGYARDRARGMTLVGPHRADLLCALGGQDVRQFASQGQQRAMVLALKLAEVVHVKQKLGAPPILLLDDVSAELDAERTRLLFEVVRGVESQVFVSTTGHVPLPIAGSPQVLRVKGGAISPEGAL